MNFLALDTSGNHLTVIACKASELYTVYLPDCTMKHSPAFMSAVEEALKKADLRLEECDFFAAVVGAGSFTGIRIGISAVKGFCSALKKPSLPITSFEVAAYTTLGNQQKTLCLIDAAHGAYYACGFEGGEVCFAPAYLTEEEVLAMQKQGYRLRSVTPLAIEGVEVVSAVDGLAQAVLEKAKKSAFGELNALYVRKSSAELNAGK